MAFTGVQVLLSSQPWKHPVIAFQRPHLHPSYPQVVIPVPWTIALTCAHPSLAEALMEDAGRS